MEVAALVPIQNREGLFAVVSQSTSKILREGHMKLYATDRGIVFETITRTRTSLLRWGEYSVVLVGIDQDGRLTLG